MRVAIVGTRFRPDQAPRYATAVYAYVADNMFPGDFIVSGGCPDSPDELAENAAAQYDIPTDIYPVRDEDVEEHGSFGKAAFARNIDIVNNCDRLVAFWDGKSKGTKHSIDLALAAHKDTEVYFP